MLGLCLSLSILFVLLPAPGPLSVSPTSLSVCTPLLAALLLSRASRHATIALARLSTPAWCGRSLVFSLLPWSCKHTGKPACKDHACKNKSGCKDKILRIHKGPRRVCYSKMHECKDIPLVKTIRDLGWTQSLHQDFPVYPISYEASRYFSR